MFQTCSKSLGIKYDTEQCIEKEASQWLRKVVERIGKQKSKKVTRVVRSSIKSGEVHCEFSPE